MKKKSANRLNRNKSKNRVNDQREFDAYPSERIHDDVYHFPDVREAVENAFERFITEDWGYVDYDMKTYNDKNWKAHKGIVTGTYDTPKGAILIMKSFDDNSLYIAYRDEVING